MARTRPPTPEIEDDGIQERPLTEVDLRFVREYLIDRDPMLAASRAGVRRINLKKRIQTWMGDPRIVRAIREQTDASDLDSMISPQRILAGFIDVAFDREAPAASRNTALRELATMKKMYGEEDRDRKTSGVLFVPGAMAIEDWDALAQVAQKRLKDEVKK
jgi:hypothetical protein